SQYSFSRAPMKRWQQQPRRALRIPRPPVFRLEEDRQQAVDLEQAVAREDHAAVLDLQVAFLPQLGEWLRKLFQDVDSELLVEVTRFEPSCLELEDYLTNQELARLDGQGAVERQLSL